MAIAHAVFAQIHSAQGDWARAEKAFQQSLNVFNQIGSLPGLLRTQAAYAQFLRQRGKTAAAQALEIKTGGKAKEIGLYLPPASAAIAST